jgi:predicted ATP-binding protein involved in virulence
MQRVRVKKIEIINFKGIDHLELDFTYIGNDKILDNIVFYGMNGSGKSTILEAINISILVARMVSIGEKELEKLEKIFIEEFSLSQEWIYDDKEEFRIIIQIEDNNNLINSTLFYNQIDGLQCLIEENKTFSDNFLKDIQVEYLSSYRLFYPSKIYHAGDWSRVKLLFNDGNHSLNLQFANSYSSIKQYLVNLITDKQVGVINSEYNEILEKIKEAFKLFFPDKIFLEKLTRTEMSKDYRLMIENEDGTVVDIDQLSSGEREIIAFFTYICGNAINRSIIIIDEPELHLHDKWQSLISYGIRKLFPNIQLFMATHSEEIHQSFSESELFGLVK